MNKPKTAKPVKATQKKASDNDLPNISVLVTPDVGLQVIKQASDKVGIESVMKKIGSLAIVAIEHQNKDAMDFALREIYALAVIGRIPDGFYDATPKGRIKLAQGGVK